MFKGLGQFGDMAKLMKQAQEMQTKMASMQDQLDNMEIWGESGAGLVKVKSNAKGKITGLIIDETILIPSEKEVIELLPDLDLVLVMSVVPGKGGQSFIPEVEKKVRNIRKAIDSQVNNGGKKTKLMIDGGVKDHNAAMVSGWGIDIAVVGSGLINDRASIKENVESIYKTLET